MQPIQYVEAYRLVYWLYGKLTSVPSKRLHVRFCNDSNGFYLFTYVFLCTSKLETKRLERCRKQSRKFLCKKLNLKYQLEAHLKNTLHHREAKKTTQKRPKYYLDLSAFTPKIIQRYHPQII